jgi:hypothetical protein
MKRKMVAAVHLYFVVMFIIHTYEIDVKTKSDINLSNIE